MKKGVLSIDGGNDMSYLFPYQVQQIKDYQERLLPIKNDHPSPPTSIERIKPSQSNKTETSTSFKNEERLKTKPKTKAVSDSSSPDHILTELTGVGQYIDIKV